MLHVITAFRHALRGETVNDAIFLESSMRSGRRLLMRTSVRMREGGAGYLLVYNYSTGIIANYKFLQHVKKISGTSGKIISLK